MFLNKALKPEVYREHVKVVAAASAPPRVEVIFPDRAPRKTAARAAGESLVALTCKDCQKGGNQNLCWERFLEDGHAIRHVLQLDAVAGH
jgi:hypothetical protein